MNRHPGFFHSFFFVRRLCLLWVSLAIVLILLSGCGGSSPGAGEAAQDTASSPQADTGSSGREDGSPAAPEPPAGEADSTAPPDDRKQPEKPFTDAGEAPESATVMVYLTGSDLEAGSEAATQDLREMSESGIDLSCTQLLVFTGGAPVWHSKEPEIPPDANVVYLLTEEGFREITRFDLLSMGDPENLARFLRFGYENYPAENHYLILWDHGNGPVMGYGSDKQYGGDSLTLPEMKTALEASPFGPDNHLALVGFDACLMSSAELMCVWADYADYLVASQELEPSMGWRYSFLKDVCTVSPRRLAKEIVDTYMAGCQEFFDAHPLFQSDLTLAVLDLSKAQTLEDSLDNLFLAAAEDVSGDFNRLAVARVKSHGFARAGSGSEYDLVDLNSLLTGMEEKYPRQASEVRQVLEETVVYNDANISESCGLSLFYPYYNKKYYKNKWKTDYASLDCLEGYASFLRRYEQVWMGTDLKELFEGILRPKAGKTDSTYTMELTPQQQEQFARGGYYILRRTGEGIYAIVYVSNNVDEKDGVLSAVFDGRIIYVSDDYGDKSIPIVRAWETVGDKTDYTILGAGVQRAKIDEKNPELTGLLNSENQPVDIQIAVNNTDGSLTVKGIYYRDDSEEIVAGKRQPVLPEDWTLFSFYNLKSHYLIRGDDGHILPYWDWPEGDWISWREYPVANGLNFTYEPLYDDGYEYYIMFEIIDVQGNSYASELLPITLQAAPEEEAAAPAEELHWNDGRSLTLLDEDGMRVDLTMDLTHSTGKPVTAVEVHSDKAFPLRVTLEDLVLDEKFSCSDTYLWLQKKDAGTGRRAVTGLSELLAREGNNHPERLDFFLTVQNNNTRGYLIYRRPYTVLFPETMEPAVLSMPAAGAAAQRQFLQPGPSPAAAMGGEDTAASGDTQPSGPATVELLAMGEGDPSASGSALVLDLQLHNPSPSAVSLHLAGLSLNGLFYSAEKKCTLNPGGTWNTSAKLQEYSFIKRDPEFSYSDRSRRITSISSVSILLGQNGVYRWYPVALSEKGDQDTLQPQGTLVWEDEYIRIRAEALAVEDIDTERPTLVWPVWVENKTGLPLRISLCREQEAEGSFHFGYVNTFIGPGSTTLNVLSCRQEKEASPESLAFYAEIRGVDWQQIQDSDSFLFPQ